MHATSCLPSLIAGDSYRCAPASPRSRALVRTVSKSALIFRTPGKYWTSAEENQRISDGERTLPELLGPDSPIATFDELSPPNKIATSATVASNLAGGCSLAPGP